MNSRISSRFEQLRAEGRKGFVTYICAGDPSLDDTVEVVRALEAVGVDLVELGVPFSDPLADGRVNQQASTRALEAGATLHGVLDCVRRIREHSQIPIVLYSYLNPIYAYGYEAFARDAARAGVDGILPLDLPVEENAELSAALRGEGIDVICLITPTSTEERVAAIVAAGSGFIYCVSREGVTGAQTTTNASEDLIARARAHTDLPIALGFGISNPEQARDAKAYADAVVVGSAIVERFHQAPHTAAGRSQAAAWVGTLVQAVKE